MELIHLALDLVAIPIMVELAAEDGTVERVDTPFHHTSTGSDSEGGGGGSGYVYTSSTAKNYPSGCLLNSSYCLTDAQTIAGNNSFYLTYRFI